jgi:hypothetical protein
LIYPAPFFLWQVLIELARYGEKPVTELEAQRLANRLGTEAYVESSALTQRNLKEVSLFEVDYTSYNVGRLLLDFGSISATISCTLNFTSNPWP